MSVDPPEFRRVLGHLATGVTVVATADPDTGEARGLTANAVTSVSLEPPLVLVCVERDADTHATLSRADHFSINILGEDQEALSRRFASDEIVDKFEGVAFRRESTGAPVLEGVLAWAECRVWARYDGGDHTIFVGRVVAGDAVEGGPLLYYRGGYGRLER